MQFVLLLSTRLVTRTSKDLEIRRMTWTEYEELGSDLRIWRLLKVLCGDVDEFLQIAASYSSSTSHDEKQVQEFDIFSTYATNSFVTMLEIFGKHKMLPEHKQLKLDSQSNDELTTCLKYYYKTYNDA